MTEPIPQPIEICTGDDRERWLLERRKGVGSSDAPAVLGISPHSNPFELSLEKRGLSTDRAWDEELLEWSRFIEPKIIERFEAETGLQCTHNDSLFRSTEPGHEFMQATPDGTVIDGGEIGGLECKAKFFHAAEWEREGIPDWVITQTQHQMRVMGWAFAFVLCLLDGYRLRFKRIERNDDILGEVVIPAEWAWWDDFVHDRPMNPTVGNQNATNRALRRLYPEDSGETISLAGAEWIEHVDRWQHATLQQKKWKAVADRHKNAIRAAMGDATFAVLDDGTEVSLKTTHVTESTTAAYHYRALKRTKGK